MTKKPAKAPPCASRSGGVPANQGLPLLPSDAYRWNRAIRGAFKKGILAQQSGLPKTACPYADKRKPSGGLSWSRSFESAWRDGWLWAEKGKAQ